MLLVRLVDISLGKKSLVDSSRYQPLSHIPSLRSLAVNESQLSNKISNTVEIKQ